MTTKYIATPNDVKHDTSVVYEGPNPIKWLFEEGDVGCQAFLTPGRYPPPGITRNMRPALLRGINGSAHPLTAEASKDGVVTIHRTGGGDTLGFTYPDTHRDIVFEGIQIEAGYRSAIMYLMNAHQHVGQDEDFENHTFLNCWINGGWDHQARTGYQSKWGVLGNRASGFLWRGGGVENICWEHAFYLHNSGSLGVSIHGALIQNCGRTAVQCTARINENNGRPSTGRLHLLDTEIKNVCLGDGGSAITISGQQGRTLIERTKVSFDDPTHGGTGAIVIWPEYEEGNPNKPGTPNGDVLVVGSEFLMPADKGDRSLVKISAVERLYSKGSTYTAGRNPVAVDLNPIGRNNGSMASDRFPVKAYHDGGGNEISGRLMLGSTWMNP